MEQRLFRALGLTLLFLVGHAIARRRSHVSNEELTKKESLLDVGIDEASSEQLKNTDLGKAILSGRQFAVTKALEAFPLEKRKPIFDKYYERLQFIVGVRIGRPLPNRCYLKEGDDGRFLGKVSLSESIGKSAAKNIVEEMEDSGNELSKVKSLETVCDREFPITENDHLIMRQPTYLSCGLSAALMVAHSNKCTNLNALCGRAEKCTEMVSVDSVKDDIQKACPNMNNMQVYISGMLLRDREKEKAKLGVPLKEEDPAFVFGDIETNVDYVILYKRHFMIMRKITDLAEEQDNMYVLRESFCGAEFVLPSEDAKFYMDSSIFVLKVAK
eukprot:gnl/Spiro4/17337_TR9238_c0_g1_i1.p1 gnl/Spiro4/17337_TR9238_c0_g1~~gnl/Spiro4/17337_TR9238_c0_g1_i1.p1  ORF type:complete len:338 (+),score=74.95 gnl/Spiro4/17337_TR9238_c0_g1_i1:30-1016(+)